MKHKIISITMIALMVSMVGGPIAVFAEENQFTDPPATSTIEIIDEQTATTEEENEETSISPYQEQEIIETENNYTVPDEEAPPVIDQNPSDAPSLQTLSNKQANNVAKELGYKDAHDLKEAYVGKLSISRYDMKYDTRTRKLYLENKRTGDLIDTGLKIQRDWLK